MALPRHHQRVRAAAAAVVTMLAAALLSSVTQTAANGADDFGQGVAQDRHEETGKVGFIGTRAGQADRLRSRRGCRAGHGGHARSWTRTQTRSACAGPPA